MATPEQRVISPAWTLQHLMRDEAEHRFQIMAILTLQ